MPYSIDKPKDLPTAVQKMSKHEQHIWVASFNNALKEYGTEERAFATAHSAVNKYKDKSPDESENLHDPDLRFLMDDEATSTIIKAITTEYQDRFENEVVEKALGKRVKIRRF